MTTPTAVKQLLEAALDMGAEVISDDDYTTVEIEGWFFGTYQADLNDDGETFTVYKRAWDRSHGLSFEQEIDSDLTPAEAAIVLRVTWTAERDEAQKLDALMAQADAWLEERVREEESRVWGDGPA